MAEFCLPPLGLVAIILISMFIIFGVHNTEKQFKNKYNSLFNKSDSAPAQESQPAQEQPAQESSPEESVETTQEEGGEGYSGGGIEEFNNDLVNPNVDITASDYEDALKSMALEQSVIDQHQKFNQELMHRVGGTSSRNPVRDDNVDEIPWVGLRRPQYQKINPNDGTARTVPSAIDADQLADYQMISWQKASTM